MILLHLQKSVDPHCNTTDLPHLAQKQCNPLKHVILPASTTTLCETGSSVSTNTSVISLTIRVLSLDTENYFGQKSIKLSFVSCLIYILLW